MTTTLTVGSFNVYRGLDFEKFKADVHRITTTNADVLGLQECHADERRRWLGEFPFGWSSYQPAWADGDPILWRTSAFEFVGHGTELVSKGIPGLFPDRYLQWAELHHIRADQRMIFVNHHANAHIEKAGHPRNLPRTRLTVEGFRQITHTLQYLCTQGLVWLTGDLNVDYDADKRVQYPGFPYVAFGNAHMIPCWRNTEERGTVRGRRTIDYVYHRRSAHVSPQKVRILRDDEYKSDHRPVLATYTIT
jgi:endonuclease/exonuclease/phosphatase family metal-dependent hydrolase